MNGPDHNDWENDPVWNLLDEAKAPEAGPFFLRNVMREVRLSDANTGRWWQRLLRPRPLLAGALGAAAAVVLISNLDSGKPGLAEQPAEPGLTPVAAPELSPTPALDELVEQEMLYQAAEDPSAFSDEALVALLY